MTDLVPLIREYAIEHYYLESWDIVADRWTEAEIAEAIKGAKTRRGAIAKAWGVLQVIDRKRRADDRPTRPVSLFGFLAARGGLKPTSDLRYILDRNVMVPRYGPLLRASGMTLDHAREACVEAGYLIDPTRQNPNRPSESTTRDLLDAIAEEARGRKRYANFEEPVHGADDDCDDASEFRSFRDDAEVYDDIPF